MNYIIRKVKITDAHDITRVVTISWNEAYKGIVPDEELEKLKHNEKEREEKFINNYNGNMIVLEIDNKVVGFANYGKAHDEVYPNAGEIIALYLIKKYQKNGFGRMLVNKAIEELKKMGYNKMIIACLKGNPTNEFYKHIGGVYLKDGIYKRLNLEENIYLYDI